MIVVVFLLVVEFPEAAVGDAGPREPVKVAPIDSTTLESERTAVVEPARTVGLGLIPGDEDDVELKAVLMVELEG